MCVSKIVVIKFESLTFLNTCLDILTILLLTKSYMKTFFLSLALALTIVSGHIIISSNDNSVIQDCL